LQIKRYNNKTGHSQVWIDYSSFFKFVRTFYRFPLMGNGRATNGRTDGQTDICVCPHTLYFPHDCVLEEKYAELLF